MNHASGRFDVPDEDIADLQERLRRTRWPTPWPAGPLGAWQAGAPLAEVQRLAARWQDFDWRAREQAIDAMPWRSATLHGVPVSYLHYEAERDDALPIVLTNGWPSSFYELRHLAERLATPSAHGGDPRDAFTVVVPCLPGFPGGEQQPRVPPSVPTHELWHALMHDELGYDEYAAHGGDLGAGTTSLLGQDHPDSVLGIHLMAIADPPEYDPADVTTAEQRYLDEQAAWFASEGAYEHQQMTRPATLGFGLSDSPVGLLAWLVEKYFAWSDNDGTLASAFDDDEVLTQASLYWYSRCIATSFRPYFEYAAGMTPRVSRVDVPTAVALFPKDLAHPPRSWAERTYDVRRYTLMPRGGHFAPVEVPDLLAADIVEFFRSLR